MKRIARFLLITTAVAAIAAMGVIGCNNGAGGGEMVNSYLSRFDPPNSGDGGGAWTPIYTLETNVSPAGGGTVTRDPNNDTYEAGTRVTIVAAAIDGYTFTGWTVTDGSVVDNAGSPSTYVIVNGDVTVTANFEEQSVGGGSGTFVDIRDGKSYKTVPIGGKEWMAENLNYGTGNSWCYDCDKYGPLYDWSTAMTACPSGWRLPSRAEWDSLARNAGGTEGYSSESENHSWWDAGKKLKSTNGWSSYTFGGVTYSGNGTDDFGFSALPGGGHGSDLGDFSIAGDYGNWWTATEADASDAYSRGMDYNNDDVYEYTDNKENGFSVRCVRD